MYQIIGGKIVFFANKNTRYMVMNNTNDNTNHVSGIDLSKYSSTLIYNGNNGTDTTSITATINGNPNDSIIWQSSDDRIVKVTGSGKTATIKAVGTGKNKVANVTVTARSKQDWGVAQTIKIKVADVTTVPTGLKLVSPKTATIYGPANTDPSNDKVTGTDRLQLTASIDPTNAYDKRIMWTTSDPNIAMVDKNGLVIARGTGTVTITGKSIANPSLPPVTTTVTVTASGTDFSKDQTLADVLNAAKLISAYKGDKTAGGGFTQVLDSPNWEAKQEDFQKAYINALGVRAQYASYKTFNISQDTAYFAAIALNESIKAMDPTKALELK
jgi:uncharacterized protein YjdB